MNNVIAMTGVSSEYEIYTGNFSTSRDKVSAFGKNRLIALIMHLKKRYSDRFFEDLT